MLAPQRLLFVYADTGAGHLATAQAVASQVKAQWPTDVEVVMFDPTDARFLHLMRRVPRLYGPIVRRVPWLWGLLFGRSDSVFGAWLLGRIGSLVFRRTLRQAISRYEPAAVVCFHALLTTATVGAVARRLPTATVVTDLGAIHRCWIRQGFDLVALPSPAARVQAEKIGIAGRHVRETGLPVGPSFSTGPTTPAIRACARAALGLDKRFTVLISGGGEGVGAMYEQAESLIREDSDTRVVVVCGRNRSLLSRVSELASANGNRIIALGFVDNMHQWIRAADILVTKAGPGTIAEALATGTALILTGMIPGQEEGNVDYVRSNCAGLWAPSTDELCAAVAGLRSEPLRLARLRRAAVAASRPNATSEITSALVELATASNQSPVGAVVRKQRRIVWVAAATVAAWASLSAGVGVAAQASERAGVDSHARSVQVVERINSNRVVRVLLPPPVRREVRQAVREREGAERLRTGAERSRVLIRPR